VTKVAAKAAGATTATGIPVPTNIGPGIDPPPVPYTAPISPTAAAGQVTHIRDTGQLVYADG
jgi:hypothetical protein